MLDFLVAYGSTVEELQGSEFDATLLDTNDDGEIGSADLLDFLIAYGATNEELGFTGGVSYEQAIENAFNSGVSQGALNEAGLSTEILSLQKDLIDVSLSLGAHGWSPINNLAEVDYNLVSGEQTTGFETLTQPQRNSLAPAVNAALNELKTWTSAFRGSFNFYDEEGGGNNFFQYTLGSPTAGSSGVVAGTPVSWSDIISQNMTDASGNALQGALDVVYGNTPNYQMWLPSSLNTAITNAGYDNGYTAGFGDGQASGGNGGNTHTSLKSYIDSNGITRDEYQRLVVAMQNLSEDGGAFTQSGFDTDNDSEIGSADLLYFLIAYGLTLDEFGTNSSTWLNPQHIYTPLMEN